MNKCVEDESDPTIFDCGDVGRRNSCVGTSKLPTQERTICRLYKS